MTAAAPPVDRPPTNGEPRTHLDVQVAGIWADLLKLPRIGLHDDFFDLGGDSLLATEMFHRVEQDCGCRVDPSRLLSGLTVERLVSEILDGSRESLTRPVVHVQAGSAARPFFFLHGDLESGGFFCRRLARALGRDVGMYAVQPHGLDGAKLPDSVEEMAADRLRSIVEIQPAGPYQLGGFCGGGIIAYEMARQLHAQGEQVAPLLLVDARPPNVAYGSEWKLAGRAASGLHLSPQLQRELFLRLKWYREDLQASGRAGPLGWVSFLGRKLGSLVSRGLWAGAGDGRDAPPLLLRYQERMAVHFPGPYTGRVALFRSSHREGRPWFDSEAGWGMLGASEDVHRIPGDHRTCVTTHVADLAALMRPYLSA
jgi:thioesterase domain-containing protein/acyl carrier protein